MLRSHNILATVLLFKVSNKKWKEGNSAVPCQDHWVKGSEAKSLYTLKADNYSIIIEGKHKILER
jgi:hypothetical protein